MILGRMREGTEEDLRYNGDRTKRILDGIDMDVGRTGMPLKKIWNTSSDSSRKDLRIRDTAVIRLG